MVGYYCPKCLGVFKTTGECLDCHIALKEQDDRDAVVRGLIEELFCFHDYLKSCAKKNPKIKINITQKFII